MLDIAMQRVDGVFTTVPVITDRNPSTACMMGDGTAPGSSGTWILGRVALSAPNSRAGAVDEPCEQQARPGTATLSATGSWCGVHDETAFHGVGQLHLGA